MDSYAASERPISGNARLRQSIAHVALDTLRLTRVRMRPDYLLYAACRVHGVGESDDFVPALIRARARARVHSCPHAPAYDDVSCDAALLQIRTPLGSEITVETRRD